MPNNTEDVFLKVNWKKIKDTAPKLYESSEDQPPAPYAGESMPITNEEFQEDTSMMDEEDMGDFEESGKKELKLSKTMNDEWLSAVRKGLILEQTDCRTHLCIVAVHKENKDTKLVRVGCIGERIGSYAYDVNKDSIQIRCASVEEIGYVPVSFRMRAAASRWWNQSVPLSDELIEVVLNEAQKKKVQAFKEKYNSEHYVIEYIQQLDVN